MIHRSGESKDRREEVWAVPAEQTSKKGIPFDDTRIQRKNAARNLKHPFVHGMGRSSAKLRIIFPLFSTKLHSNSLLKQSTEEEEYLAEKIFSVQYMVDVKAKPFSDEKRWVVIYPTYLDSKKSLQQGRKIPKGMAVENPTSSEIFDVLTASGLNPVLERGKLHPREQDREPEKLGRVRVMLKNDDGTVKNKDYPTRAALYKYFCRGSCHCQEEQEEKVTCRGSTSFRGCNSPFVRRRGELVVRKWTADTLSDNMLSYQVLLKRKVSSITSPVTYIRHEFLSFLPSRLSVIRSQKLICRQTNGMVGE
ncbi:hypothetical protein GCK32_007128 [Trichostrongylus colubriformis]|uniref:Signal recognition particle 19 kDa protein n=1 Tax=Trichostrongylus colubriformis TaxID=6319 RepID=A0AAN8IF22_TRICO